MQERTLVEEAWPGDILGLWDSGALLRIGDTLSEGEPVAYEGIPRFSPEHFVKVVLLDPMNRRQLKKGLDELTDEGAVQVFHDPRRAEREPILGAVSALQFEVIQYRLKAEHGAEVSYVTLPYQIARWVEGEGFDPRHCDDAGRTASLEDVEGRPLVLFQADWYATRAQDQNPKLSLVAAVRPGRAKG